VSTNRPSDHHNDALPDDLKHEDAWGASSPLRETPGPGPAATLDTSSMLVQPLGECVENHSRQLDADPKMTAGPLLASLSGLLAGRVVVGPREHADWKITPNVSSLIIAPVSAGKTPAARRGMEPFRYVEHRLRQDWAARWSSEPDHDKKPPAPVLETSDATVQAISQKLGQQQAAGRRRGLTVYQDELTALFAEFERRDAGGARPFFLKAMTGGDKHTVHRVGREDDYVDPLNVNIIGGIQPGPAQEFVNKALDPTKPGADGFLQRFGLAFIVPRPGHEFDPTDEPPDRALRKRMNHIAWELGRPDIDLKRLGCQPDEFDPEGPQVLRFDATAAAEFVRYERRIRNACRRGDYSDALTGHLSKSPETLASIAALYHCVSVITDTVSAGSRIGLAALVLALKLQHLLNQNAALVYGESNAALPFARAIMRDRSAGKIKNGDTVRSIATAQRSGLRTTGAVRMGFGELERRGLAKLRRRTKTQDGRRIPGGKVSEQVFFRPGY